MFSYTFPGNSEEGRHETTTSFCGRKEDIHLLFLTDECNYLFTNEEPQSKICNCQGQPAAPTSDKF